MCRLGEQLLSIIFQPLLTSHTGQALKWVENHGAFSMVGEVMFSASWGKRLWLKVGF